MLHTVQLITNCTLLILIFAVTSICCEINDHILRVFIYADFSLKCYILLRKFQTCIKPIKKSVTAEQKSVYLS